MAKAQAAAKIREMLETEEPPLATPNMSQVQQKIFTGQRELKATLIERDDEIDMDLTGMIAGEHTLRVGPPGTAKTLLADSVASMVDGPYGNWLMKKDQAAEEVFGPQDIQALLGTATGQSEYKYLTQGYLPQALVAHFDEIFKAGPAVLNRLLKVLNERQFLNGYRQETCPLIFAMASSNEWPEGEELGALFDRFLLRRFIKPIQSSLGRQKLVWADDLEPKLSVKLTEAEIRQVQQEAAVLPWEKTAVAALDRILKELPGVGIVAGDRRTRKTKSVCRAYAYLCGAQSVETEHLEILQNVLWVDPAEQPQKAAELIVKIANPSGAAVNQLRAEAQQILEGANLNDMQSMIVTSKKLQEIMDKLRKLKKTEKVEVLFDYLAEEEKQLKIKAMEKAGF